MKLDFKSVSATGVDAAALASDLKKAMRGEVRFDTGSRALYSYDGSNYRQVPIGVVVPYDVDDAIAAVGICHDHGAPLLNRGGGTSLAGQCCNVAVVIDFSKRMNNIIAIDAEEKFALVEPGVVCDDLRHAAERHHLTWAPDPSTHKYCTMGGMIGNNSCGVHSIMGGKAEENVIALEILTYDGERMWVGQTSDDEVNKIVSKGGRRGQIYADLRTLRDRYADMIRERFPQIPRRVSGYNLNRLLEEHNFDVAKALVGTESTCVTILQAKVRLVESPPVRSVVVLGFPSVYEAADRVPQVMKHGPIGLEGLDDRLIGDMKKKHIHPQDIELVPPGKGWLLVEFGGDSKDEADGKAHALIDSLKGKNAPSTKLFDRKEEEKQLWEVRESGLGATARVPGGPDTWEGWEDSAVPPEKMGDYLRDLRALFDRHGYDGSFYGHFGQGCLHTRINFDLKTRAGIKNFRSFIEEAADLVVGYGGSLSGEHGDGQSRAELLPRMFGREMVRAFGEFKAIWDPGGKMNPHKVIDPYKFDENLRLGSDYHPWDPKTNFAYTQDDGSFNRAVLRCVGVGQCRKHDSGTMCPSFMATREEKHSTRGRARTLFEMMEGEVVTDGWRSNEVKEALDLCLACKACKAECPMGVDMATYKAEFLSHHYKRRLRPRAAYAMGLMQYWARIGGRMPRLANFVSHSAVLSPALKRIGGVAAEREIPPFATQTFKQWFRGHQPRRGAKGRVILWPDTWNNYFHPDVAKAAVEVLEAADYEVTIPEASLCCGRPLYDYGMLTLARRSLRQVLRALQKDIQDGVPLIGLEPSCVSVFKDEMLAILPRDEDAKRLSKQTYDLSEFLENRGYIPPALTRSAIVQSHCHHKAVLKIDSERALMTKLGLNYELLDDGCCGMAGSFGFEQEKFEVSIAIGERGLLPAVREAGSDVLIVADGFSCREQISQTTDRSALHLSQVLQMALREGPNGPTDPYPERDGA
ncbi:MAG TPA: FAD-linked oxidase C-terminal domain-containing protein [Actinomycetota bacterium]|nr:FAD-linked oxidase C-terminal domain-containing protein [Actinomycetota bacterium]